MAGNSERRGARQRGKGLGPKGNTAGSGGRARKALEGKGPTPKAEDRVYHKAYKAKQFNLRQEARQGGRAAPGSRPKAAKAAADMVVGRNAVLEALQAGLPVKAAYVAEGAERDDRLRDIFRLAAEASLTLLQTPRPELDRLTGNAVHQGVALQLPPFAYADAADILETALERDGLIVACDHLTDPHNLGAVIRSAAAFGAAGAVIPSRRSADVTAAAWKASAGAAARLPVAKVVNLNQALATFAQAGCHIVGLAGEAETDLADADIPEGPVVLVVGSEGDGLARLTRDRCDQLVRIPITAAVESLNASVATGIALYHLTREKFLGDL
ncbi:MAG: 23S rRNA (guanosine(2251)-2'-O)-methyltransferase RlmB [Propionibacteriaceae bacterium]|jgi:23S rRNA (guanosine2251-2'-O)-methyltransferase|nr:23S rRNA (guanosine(2251)-2'-O)-methyltransferase RlmB [Propionibacteriaceae bacterium]